MTAPSTVPDLQSPELIADPYRGFDRVREEAPVVRGRFLDGSDVWYVTRAADVRAVLGDPRFVNDATSVPGVEVDTRQVNALRRFGVPDDLAGYLGENLLGSDPPDHTRLRRLVSRAFTVRRVAELRPRVEAITATLLPALEAAPQPADLIETFAYPLPITVICELVGVGEADRPAWREWGRALVTMDPERLAPALRQMVDHVHALIAARRATPADDLLTALVRVRDEDGDRLSDEELVSMVLTLVLAGHETTAHLIGNGTYALLTHPDQLAVLRADPSLWPAAVRELVRFCGPVHVTRLRHAVEDVEVGGTTIRRGDAVQAVLVSANFDPREHPDPHRLDVTRLRHARGDGHVGFGHGPHYCLGAALARQEAEVALSMLVTRFPDLALATDTPRWAPVPGSRRLVELPVRVG
jgi:cytochrome P450